MIEKINKACELIDQAEAAGVEAAIKVDVDGLSVEIRRSVDGLGYYLTGFYMPEAVEGEDV